MRQADFASKCLGL